MARMFDIVSIIICEWFFVPQSLTLTTRFRFDRLESHWSYFKIPFKTNNIFMVLFSTSHSSCCMDWLDISSGDETSWRHSHTKMSSCCSTGLFLESVLYHVNGFHVASTISVRTGTGTAKSKRSNTSTDTNDIPSWKQWSILYRWNDKKRSKTSFNIRHAIVIDRHSTTTTRATANGRIHVKCGLLFLLWIGSSSF